MRRPVRVIARHIVSRGMLGMLSVLVLATFLLSGCSTVTTGEETPETPVGQIIPARLAIVHTSALQGYYAAGDGRIGLATLVGHAHQLEEDGYDVLLLDSGNSLIETASLDTTDGENAVGFLNAAGYDALALGASELSLGSRTFVTRNSQSDFVLLSANATKGESETLLSDANTTVKLSDGRLIGLFALTAPTDSSEKSPLHAGQATGDADALVTCAQEQVAALRKQDCRLVVCLTNLGQSPGELTATQLAERVSGIDVILDAGTEAHQTAQDDASGEETLVVTTPGGLMGATTVFWEQGTLSAKPFDPQQDEVQADEQMDALVNQTSLERQTWLETSIATSPVKRTHKLARKRECVLGDLVADAALWEGRHAGALIAPDAALVDAGSIQAPLRAGDVTRADALTICPHATTHLYTMQVSGAQLHKAIETVLTTSGASDDFPQVAGLTITLHKASKTKQANVTIKTVGDDTFSKDEKYLIVVTERIATASGVYKALAGSEVNDLDTSAGEALINYLARACHGTIPKDYDEPQGRITVS